MQATFYALGINHETAAVATGEAFALGEDAQERVHTAFRAGAAAPDEDGPELVLLSTCNRTEAYLYGTESDTERLRGLLACEAGQSWPAGEAFLQADEAAVQHVLEVAAGLRSLVPGDAQILAQMKDAYRRAVEADAVGMVGHRLMHTAFRAAKRVQRETSLSSGAASVSTAAVALAEDFFQKRLAGGWTDRHALLVGAGRMGRLALESLAARTDASALASVAVANRSPERAEAAARAFAGARVVPWGERHAAAARADLVIVATGAGEPTLRADALPERSPAADAATLIVDIARPRNADPAIARRPGYALYDMDALQHWVDQIETARRDALPAAHAICEELRGEFVSWVFHQEALQPAIQAIRSTFESIRQQEIERYAHRFSGADAGDLERLTQSILQKLLAVPIVRLKGADDDSIDFSRGIRLLRTLFSRPDECEDDGAAPAGEEEESGLQQGNAPPAARALSAPTGEPSAPRGERGENAPAGNATQRPMDAPARCPFETHQPEASERGQRVTKRLFDTLERPSPRAAGEGFGVLRAPHGAPAPREARKSS